MEANIAVSGNPKNVRQSQTNSVFFPPNNEKKAIQAKQDRLKREQYRIEHKAPNPHVEVAIIDLHRTPESYIPISPRQPNQPAAAIPRVEELESS